jgi:hypothetical protein
MTTTEWIALAGIGLSAFLGWLAYQTGRDARKDAHALAKETREAQSGDARAARLHERRKDIYVEVLEYALLTEDTVDRIEPLMTWDGAPGPPEWPNDDELRRQSARVLAVASRDVREKLYEMKRAYQAFRAAAWELDYAKPRVQDLTELHLKVHETRQAVKDLILDVIDLTSRELAE